jgi:hypothetical protein
MDGLGTQQAPAAQVDIEIGGGSCHKHKDDRLGLGQLNRNFPQAAEISHSIPTSIHFKSLNTII